IRTAALGLALATLTIAQEAPDSFLAERILAPNALLFLSLPQSASITDDYAKSNLAKLVNHPEIKSFTGPLESWWKKRKTQPANVGGRMTPSYNEMARQMTGLTIDEIWDLLQGPLSFAVYDVPSSDQ